MIPTKFSAKHSGKGWPQSFRPKRIGKSTGIMTEIFIRRPHGGKCLSVFEATAWNCDTIRQEYNLVSGSSTH